MQDLLFVINQLNSLAEGVLVSNEGYAVGLVETMFC